MKKSLFLTIIFFLFFLFGFNLNSYSQGEVEMYFCKDYRFAELVGIDSMFTKGWLTVVVDYRKADEIIGVEKVKLTIYGLEYDENDKPILTLVTIIPFFVDPEMEIIIFKDPDRLYFTSEGDYLVVCQTEEDETIAYGVVQIVSEDVLKKRKKDAPKFVSGENRKGIEFYTNEIKKDAENKNNYFKRAVYYDKAELFDSAIFDYKKCLKIDDDFEDAKANLAYSYLHKEDYEKAMKVFKELEKKYPGYQDVKLGIALTYFELKNYDKSKSYIDAIIKVIYSLRLGIPGVDEIKSRYNYQFTYYDYKLLKEMFDYFGYKY